MHGWLPDSYTYAPTTSSALIAPLGTKVAAYSLFRMLFFVFGLDYFSNELPVADLIAVFSCGGIIFRSIMAIAQKEMKRMLHTAVLHRSAISDWVSDWRIHLDSSVPYFTC